MPLCPLCGNSLGYGSAVLVSTRPHVLTLSRSSIPSPLAQTSEPLLHFFCTTFCTFLGSDPCNSTTYEKHCTTGAARRLTNRRRRGSEVNLRDAGSIEGVAGAAEDILHLVPDQFLDPGAGHGQVLARIAFFWVL